MTLENAQPAALRAREASTAIGRRRVTGFKRLRDASGKGITVSVRKSIILLALTAVALTVASPQAAAAQQTAPALGRRVWSLVGVKITVWPIRLRPKPALSD